MFDFEIKIAQTPGEIEAAQKLRFDVFNLEKGKGITTYQEGIDADKYDKYCDHLIVIDRSFVRVVGTYRLLLSSRIDKDIGFHSEGIFNIDDLKKKNCKILELGRSCVHKDYRNSAVINLLWSGIAEYVKENDVKYIFGCARLDTVDPQEVNEAHALLKQQYCANGEFKIKPHRKNIFKDLICDIHIENFRKSFRKLSPLIKGYLNIGAKVCGEPAINLQFGSVVFFMLLDTEEIKDSYKRHFLNASLNSNSNK